MHGTAGRIGVGFLALAAIWIGVYWFWEPSRAPDVTFADEGPAAPEPVETVPVEITPPARSEATPLIVEPPASSEPPGAAPAEDAPAVIPPEFRDYTVRRNDTFSTISRRMYGSTRHADAIAAANPFVSPTNLREGQVLRIPADPENVQGRPVPGRAEPATEPELIEYVVERGDTLSEIAQKFYGSLRYAEVIFNANRDTMASIDDLQVGQVLRIPSPESVLGGGDR